MKKTLAVAAIGAALLLSGCGKKDADSTNVGGNTATALPGAPYSGQDWSLTVTKTPEGGFRMGNPDAPYKLVEYASMTCPHCRDFTKAGAPVLKEQYVKTGKVSWEYRTFVLNPLDVAASLVARCQGPETFFPFVEQLFATQGDWVGKFNSVDEKTLQSLGALPQHEQFIQLVTLSGLEDFFKAHGVPGERIKACLSDKGALDQLLKIRDHGANTDKIDGTPNFLINGEKQEGVYDWPGLETKLREKVR
ncbi:thioredoxin domain-containing protein [Sphingomonas sp. SRS2]|uniref:thioredoxin domain-containing protein n=1 Tax=Sphingomonas sp. SRS2 TaxID=133190 RepID=UPI0006184E50|nr:thioredoxin domain-containing protein [Sphingomonas sp. SRS2]KKC23802.1 protein-disulfide isomerase [Sphingomonas sp. SRS2]